MMDQTGGLYISIPGTVLYSSAPGTRYSTVLYKQSRYAGTVQYCTVRSD